jgi:exodeoxyribonuclease VII large subunit
MQILFAEKFIVNILSHYRHNAYRLLKWDVLYVLRAGKPGLIISYFGYNVIQMEKKYAEKAFFTLFELNSVIKSAISDAFQEACWVAAEIADLKCNQKGHCYLELVEKEGAKTTAQIKATIWAYDYRRLGDKFEKNAKETLKSGMKVLLLVEVSFHEVYGLSLNIKDIDPAYTLGEMARRKKEVIDRLRKEGVMELNRSLPLPLVPQRVAVISSPTAAGYGDFFKQLDNNLYGYKFTHVLFPAMMQGQGAEHSIISSFDQIRKKKGLFDVVVIIRGGGSVIDLNCFDGYELASEAARFPLPVITGIGHEKDDTVVDMVANTKLKTPTAVAEFLISGLRSYEEDVMNVGDGIRKQAERLLKDRRHKFDSLVRGVSYIPLRISAVHKNKLTIIRNDLGNRAARILVRGEHRTSALEQAMKHLDPANVLRRGYSITRHKGRVLKSASVLKKWAVIQTELSKGDVTSIVQDRKEAAKGEQKQTDILLPGLE